MTLLHLLHEFQLLVQVVLILFESIVFIQALFESQHLGIKLFHILSGGISLFEGLLQILEVLWLVAGSGTRRVYLLREGKSTRWHRGAHWQIRRPCASYLLPRLFGLLLLLIVFLEDALV